MCVYVVHIHVVPEFFEQLLWPHSMWALLVHMYNKMNRCQSNETDQWECCEHSFWSQRSSNRSIHRERHKQNHGQREWIEPKVKSTYQCSLNNNHHLRPVQVQVLIYTVILVPFSRSHYFKVHSSGSESMCTMYVSYMYAYPICLK